MTTETENLAQNVQEFVTVDKVIASNISPINPDISEPNKQMQPNIHNENKKERIYEPRTIYKSYHIKSAPKPSENLSCLYACILLLFVLTITALTCIDRYIINIYINPYDHGMYYWQFGWTNAIFYHEDALLIREDQVPMQFAKRYAVDAGHFYIICILIILVFLLLTLIILCSRCNNQVYLYIKCCGIRIPQSPALYILFSTIKHYSRISILFYLFCMVYGTLEMNFYSQFVGQCLAGPCANFAVVHYGLVSLFFMVCIIDCFVMKRVLKLDKAFNNSTLEYYYPNHVRRMNAGQCKGISLDYLKSCIHTIRIILICTSVILIAFHNCGLILIGDCDKNTQSFSLFFQFKGLRNDKGIYYDNVMQAHNYVLICWIFYYILLPFIIIFNVLALFYFYYVIIKFRCICFCKCILILFMLIEWLSFTALSVLYYYTFYEFWNSFLKYNTEHSLYYDSEREYDMFWCPDWGVILILLIDWYLLKLIGFTFKSM